MLLLTFLVASLGAYVGYRLKVPAGIIVGAIVFVALANLTVGVAPIPSALKWLTQVIAGAFIGTGLTRTAVKDLPSLAKPGVIILFMLIGTSVVLGLALYYTSSVPMDLRTALFSTVPGGIAEMSVIADDMGADMALVSVFQLARLTATMCTFPFFITHIMRAEKNTQDVAPAKKSVPKAFTLSQWAEFALAMAAAAVAGAVGSISGFPGGALLFAVIATGFLKIRFDKGIVPRWAKRAAQVLVGAYIGAKITNDVLKSALKLWPYVVFIVASYLVSCLFTAWLLSKTTKVDKLTAAFSCTPAGSSDMALIASEFDTETPTIAALQIVRLVGVIGICPSLISLLLQILHQ